MLRVLVNGVLGKMGRVVVENAATIEDIMLVAGVDLFAAGAQLNFPLYESLDKVDVPVDVLIDFSRADALGSILEFCVRTNTPAVLATTAYSAEDESLVKQASEKVAIFRSANMSLGINLLREIGQQAAQVLSSFDIEIMEKHHNTKVDAPSGTAYILANAINETLISPREYVYERHSRSARRASNEIGIHSLRGGTVVGEHEILFLGPDEEVVLKHAASSRRIYATGALKAAQYVSGKGPGFYDMQDLLLEKESGVTGLSVDDEQALLSVKCLQGQGLGEVFKELGDAQINVDMISMGMGGEVSLTIPKVDVQRALQLLQGKFAAQGEDNITKLTIEGQGMERQAGVAGSVFSVLGAHGAQILLITTSETKIGLCVPTQDKEKAILALREHFSLS